MDAEILGVGPLMILIYTNELIDVLEKLNMKVKLFADDVKFASRLLMTLMFIVQHLQLHCAIGLRHGSNLSQ